LGSAKGLDWGCTSQYYELMEDLVFRGMRSCDDGKPQLGQSALALGVRVPKDITPDAAGDVRPGTGGMSVAPDSELNVPNHLRPKAMGYGSSGPNNVRMYAIAKVRVSIGNLTLRPDPEAATIHAFVEPGQVMPLVHYEGAISSTRDDWRKIWPLF
jgi:hypothetical protein